MPNKDMGWDKLALPGSVFSLIDSSKGEEIVPTQKQFLLLATGLILKQVQIGLEPKAIMLTYKTVNEIFFFCPRIKWFSKTLDTSFSCTNWLSCLLPMMFKIIPNASIRINL